jgi:hypothetical protein
MDLLQHSEYTNWFRTRSVETLNQLSKIDDFFRASNAAYSSKKRSIEEDGLVNINLNGGWNSIQNFLDKDGEWHSFKPGKDRVD